MKYVKKPVVVEAFQFGVDEYPDWFVERDLVFQQGSDRILIPNPQGQPVYANIGDMVIKDIKGEIYPCKKDIFDAFHEPFVEKE